MTNPTQLSPPCDRHAAKPHRFAAIAVTVLLFHGGTTHAREYKEELRILGPAASYHFSSDGALSRAAPPTWDCNAEHVTSSKVASGEPSIMKTGYATFQVHASPYVVSITSNGDRNFTPTGQVAALLGPAGDAAAYASGATGHAINFRATSRLDSLNAYNQVACSTSDYRTTYEKVGWHQTNPAIGLEKSWRYADHVDKAYGSFVRDSYGKPSAMLGVGRQWPLVSARSVSIDGGLVAGLWYRSVLDDAGTSLKRGVVPFVLPALTINEQHTGLGLNVAFAPQLKIGNRALVATSTVMFQLTYLIRKSESESTNVVGIQTTPDGGLQASFRKSFQ
jgi:hypothetical protein